MASVFWNKDYLFAFRVHLGLGSKHGVSTAGLNSATKYKPGCFLVHYGRTCLHSWAEAKATSCRGKAVREWPIYDHDVICQRYNRIAAFIPFFEYVFFIPFDFRKRAVDQLKLRRGNRVLEVGCGTGRNFAFLRDAVGPEGRVYGVDLSEGMLCRARKLCQRRRWNNFVLIEADAANYVSQELFDGVLFSFSYNVMPHHRSVLRQVWKQLRPGGRLVIMDARLPPGRLGKLVRPFATWLMKQTLFGKPLIQPWQYHAALVDDFHMEDFRFSSYYICCGTKPG